MQEIIFTTGNEDKMREIRGIFEGLPLMIHSFRKAGLISNPGENDATFTENIFIKAEAIHALRLDAIMMPDDSGLSVDYLSGKPDVFSTRWLGRDTSYTEKNAEPTRHLEGTEGDTQSARFTVAVAYILPDGIRLPIETHMEERIVGVPVGENGFGYDPILYLPGYGKCSAELSEYEEDTTSHHGGALRQMQEKLRGIYADTMDRGV